MSRQTNSSVAWAFPADLLVEVHRGAGRGLRDRLEQDLRAALQHGRLKAGTRLPPSRTLAAELGIARSVVVAVYEQLIAEGYLEARQGAGTEVRAGFASIPAADPPRRDGSARLFGGLPDPALFDRRSWLRAYRAALAELPEAELTYPGPLGARALRYALARYLGRVRGVVADPERMLITTGFTQALTLLCRALARSGASRVAVEDPCFGLHRETIKAAGLEPVPVPADSDGIDVSRLPNADAVLVAPAHSYPLGGVLSAVRRHALIAWAREHDAWLLEDDYDAEFRYDRAAIGALQGLAPDRVVYAGCASKTLTPALRLGWMAAPPELVDALQAEKLFDDMGTGLLDQIALARFIEGGGFARHLRHVRPIYRARRNAALRAVAQALPGATAHGVAAGLHLYIALSPGTDEQAVVTAARRGGALLEPSAWHWAQPETAPPGLVLGYGGVPEATLQRVMGALRVLGCLEPNSQ
jgi:GntR family transcriptional regulator/MocR family aminotransferase